MPKRKAPVTSIPKNLEMLSKKQLINLIQLLDQERNLPQKKQKTSEPNVDKMKKKFAKKLITLIKKCRVNASSKPWAEVHEGVTLEYAQNFIGEIGIVKKDTKRLFVKTLEPAEISKLLPELPQINVAKWTGHVWNFAGAPKGNPKVSTVFAEGEFKYDKSSNMMTIRVRVMQKPYDLNDICKDL